MNRRLTRGAFTLVELLVVIAIIGVLVALLLPAVQAAREAARRAQCTNNLKQLGLALHNYHDTFRTLPYSSTYGSGQPKHTWVEFILPFVEQGNLHDLIDFNVANDTTANRALLENVPLAFISCPSNPVADQMYPNAGTTWSEGFPSQGLDYPLSAGTILPDGATPDCASTGSFCITETAVSWNNPIGKQSPGIFNRGVAAVNMSSITDGTSNTFFAGERLAQSCNWGGAFTWNFPVAYAGQKPNSPTRNATASDYRRNCGFSSQHPGGVNMLKADASVSFIAETVDFATWCYLHDKADGRVIGAY